MRTPFLNSLAALLTLCCFSLPGTSSAGTWAPLVTPPPIGVNNCVLLSDGTVLAMNGGGQCAKLTPNVYGSYINGSWTTLPTMTSSRLFFASDVLTNGNVYVAGGEYGDPNHWEAELYNPLANTWTVVPGSSMPNFNYSDSPSEMLPNGNLLVSDSQSTYYFYSVVSNAMIYGGSCQDMNEVCWVKLTNGSIFCVDNYGNGAEHFAPTANEWIIDAASTPTGARGGDDENYLLPNGQVFHAGSVSNTAFYTPNAAQTGIGRLTNGPTLPLVGTNQLYAGESPGAILTTGNILLELAPDGGGASGGSPCYFYEYNYLSNDFTRVGAPGGEATYSSTPFATSMLMLPDGSVLFVGGQNSSSLYVYKTTGIALEAGQPAISNITENVDGTYEITGTKFNGISEGAMYGDDEQMACNYPLVRLTNTSSGFVYYARTYGWNNTTVQSPRLVTTQFALPPNLPAGTYSLVVTAVGNASTPILFTNSPVIPAAPTGLTASANGSYAYLKWDTSPGATVYYVKRATSSSGTFTTVATLSGITSYTDSKLAGGVVYYYMVSAANGAGQSANSTVATVTGPLVLTTAVQHGAVNTYPFTPSWVIGTNDDLILGQSPTTAFGIFTNLPAAVGERNVDFLTDGVNLTIDSVAAQSGGTAASTNYVTCGTDGSGACLIYSLSSSIYGATISNITVFGGWQDNGRDQQAYAVYYSTPSNPQNFIPLTTVNYSPVGVANSTPASTRVTMTPAPGFGVLATNVAMIKFVWPAFLPSEGGDCGYAQIAVYGSPGPVAITEANEYGSPNTYPFTPSWTVQTNDDLILDHGLTADAGNFNNWPTTVGSRLPRYLTDGGTLTIDSVAGRSGADETSTNYVVCGSDGSGSSVTYALGGTYGCTVTNITVYGGWQDNGRDAQAYTVFYSTVAAPNTFLRFGDVNFNPSGVPANTPSATRVTIAPTAPDGTVLENVASLKFNFTTPASENGSCGYAEIGVYGYQSQPPPSNIAAPDISSGNLTITGGGGVPNTGYTVLFTTNLIPPIFWTTNSTGTFNTAGAFSNSLPIDSTTTQGFFRLQVP